MASFDAGNGRFISINLQFHFDARKSKKRTNSKWICKPQKICAKFVVVVVKRGVLQEIRRILICAKITLKSQLLAHSLSLFAGKGKMTLFTSFCFFTTTFYELFIFFTLWKNPNAFHTTQNNRKWWKKTTVRCEKWVDRNLTISFLVPPVH